MNSNFPACVGFVLAKEGGHSNDPHDPGQETNFGISKRAHPNEDIRGMTRGRASEIYRETYWAAVHGDDLPAGVDLVLFDMAVNAGPKAAVKLAQHAVQVAVDGTPGPLTLGAIKAAKPAALINAISDARLRFYKGLPGWSRYGRGWEARVEACRSLALAMALASNSVADSNQPSAAIKHTEIAERPGWLGRLIAAIASTFRKA